MKLLLANGCSHTAGSDIDPENMRYCAEKAWPRYVADHFKIPYVNIAEGGSGNEQINRSTILTISNLIDIDEFDPKNLIVNILWSGFDRYEYWSDQHQQIRSFALSSTRSPYNPGEIVKKYIEYRSLVEPEHYSFYKNLYYIYNTAKFLESYGIKYYFACGLNSFQHPSEIQNGIKLKEMYCNLLELYGDRIDKHLAFFDNSKSFRTYLQDVPRSKYGMGTHWDDIGQQKYAEFFIKHIESIDENPFG
jgi:hypothetical protein